MDKEKNEPIFSVDIDSICYGCRHYGEDGCGCLELCVEGDMLTISSE